MKQQIIFGFLLLLLLLLTPIASFSGAAKPEPPPAQQTTAAAAQATAANSGGTEDAEAIPVYLTASGQSVTVGLEEYLTGCLAAEVSPNTHEEALKAQAVACHTFARYRLEVAGNAAVTDTGASDQGYFSQAQRRDRWGGNFALYEKKLQEAVRAVRNETLVYDGQPICAAFFAISPGKTESALNYWGVDYPYLQPQESPGDRLAPDYTKTTMFSKSDMKDLLKQLKGAKPGSDPAKWFGKPTRSASGTILEIEIAGQTITGRAARELLGLRSADFDVTYNAKDGFFKIVTRGYGHGVGMSQYGADFMARQGSGYEEILAHYYAGAQLAAQ
ncbi:MAG: stage II sporulation protein D [Oscillospiraceae bacterium]|jgi:stage II sporulation protein D|nr:stage II sporulation protein D [Oscillospiraceae bacterium]